MEDATCAEGVCSAELMLDTGASSGSGPLYLPFTWPDTSQSDVYYYTVHPDYGHLSAGFLRGLGYASLYGAPAAVILADEATAGVYDTVYVDADFDQDLGDEKPMSKGDEAHVVNNSWGDSAMVQDGWDTTSRFAQYLNLNYAPNTLFLAATGNGGPGYGTTTAPNGGTLLKVGASTSYGSSTYWELVGPEQFTYGAIQPWSNRGPSGLGDVDPDLVCVGAWGFGSTPLNRAMNGQGAYDLFGGTSMSSPLCTGVAALVYDSFHEAHGRWPTWQEATDILNNSAHDLGYNALAQGAGNADALRATAIAAGDAAYMTPSQWQVGDYRGDALTPGFPAIVHPGDSVSLPLTVHNPTAAPITTALQDVTLQRVHEINFTVTLGQGTEDGITPDYLRDITELIDEYDPDLLSAHVMFPFSEFDADRNYYSDMTVTTLFYDWKDLNGDGNLWQDDNDNGLVDTGEIDMDGPDGFEFNRYTYGYATANYQLTDLGREALSQRHDGVFLGLQRYFGSDDLEVTIQLILYKKADWEWLSLSAGSLNVPADGQATVTATMTVPADAGIGLYEGAIEYDGQVIPVITHVAADTATFDFGAASLDETLGDTPYDNGHLLGSTDWGWRPETGDWKQFYYDVADGAADSGTGMVVTTEWAFPEPIEITPLPESLLFEQFDDGIPWDWTVIDNVEACSRWVSSTALAADNWTGGEGPAAEASSNYCMSGMDTELYTPAIDLTGQTEAWPAFRTHFIGNIDWQGTVIERGIVDISDDGGATWTQLLDLTAYTFTPRFIDLSEYAGSTIQLRFHYVALSWSFWWQLDDVGIFLADPTAGYAIPVPDLTDVDTTIFGATEDDFATGDPAFFGPSGVARTGGSRDAWLTGGTWQFFTETGGPKEIVGGIASEGLGYISLHNVLNAGRLIGEPVVGQAFEMAVAPAPLAAEATTIISANPPTVGATIDATLTTTADLAAGVGMVAFGPSQPIVLTGESIAQDNPNSLCEPSWKMPITIEDGGLLEVTTSSDTPNLDVDLILVGDNGDGVFDCVSDSLIIQSAGPTSDEYVVLKQPIDATYFVAVHGYSVPGGAGTFDITIRAIQGHNMTIDGVPEGAVAADTPLSFQISAEVPYEVDSAWEGLLFVGPAENPTALNFPVAITVPALDAGGLDARLNAGPDGLTSGETTTIRLRVWNDSLDSEMVAVAIDVPPGLTVNPASLNASQGQAHFNVANRAISWSGTLAGSSGLTITFDAAASSLTGQVAVEATVDGLLRGNRLELSAPVWVNVDAPTRLIHMPLVAGN